MKNTITAILFSSMIAVSGIASAAQTITMDPKKNDVFAPVFWSSSSPQDVVTVQGAGYGPGYTIVISVERTSGMGARTGATILNCDGVTHINVGSIAICHVDDVTKPLTISSDTPNVIAAGTLQVK